MVSQFFTWLGIAHPMHFYLNVTSSEMPSLNHSTLGGHSSYHSLSTTVFIISILVIICVIFFIYLFTTCLHQETVSSKEAEVHLSDLKFYTVSFTVPLNPRCSVKTDWLMEWKSTYFSVLGLNEATNTLQHFQKLFHTQ